jgi:hypothetical protein
MSDTTSEHSPSLRAALEQSYTQHTTPDATPAAAGTGDAPSRAVEGEGGAQSPGGAPPEPSPDGRQRDAQGRFAPKPGDAPAGAATGSSAAPEPPEGYDPAVWAMLSPEAREKTVAWAKSQGSKYEPFNGLDRVLTQQRRDALAMQYGGVDKAMEQLFALSDFASRDPTNFVRQFAAQRGVNLAQLQAMQGGQPQQGQQQPQMTPEQAFRTIARQEAEQAQQRLEVNRAYDDFAKDVAAEHRENPKVREVMAVLLATNQANDYRQAYDMAVRAHPELGPKWAQAQAETTAKAQQEQAAETARAKASAAASVVGAPGTARPNADAANRNQSVRAALEGAFERAGGARV